MDCILPYSACLQIPGPSHQSDEEMCIEKRSEGQTGGSSEDNQSRASSYKESMTVRDAEHSSASCSGSDLMESETCEADLSDVDRPEVNENRQDPCPLCKEIFPNPAEYTLHLKKHTDGTKCLVCGKILSSANSLDRHLLVHSGEKPFECPHCGKAFTTNGNMNRHKKKRKHFSGPISNLPEKRVKKGPINNEISNPTSSNMSKGRMHNCEHCIFGCDKLIKTGLRPENFDLISKMDCERRRTCPLNTKETDKLPDGEKESQVCDTCGDVCLRMDNLHSEAQSDELFLCNKCGCGFNSSPRFLLHQLSHKISRNNPVMNFDTRNEDDKDVFLEIFGLFKTREMNDITAHCFYAHGHENTCELKEESVKDEKILNSSPNHSNDSNTQATNASSVVSLSSKSTRNVTSPMSADCASPVSNTVEAPASPIEGSTVSKECSADNELQCKECGECFKTKKLLKIHYHQIHLQKNTFRCPQCIYVSMDKSTLTRHIRTHTGEQPYMCTICHRKFTTETNARRHIKNKHNVFNKPKKYILCQSSEKSNANQGNTKCHYCKKDFGDPKLLTQHKNAPDCPGKPFICSKCPMRFPTKNNCLRHMTHQHKLEKDQAREAMIIDKFDPDGKKENNTKLQRIEMILDAADSEITLDNGSEMHSESVEQEHEQEENQFYINTNENHSTGDEMELVDMSVTNMSQNSSKAENETIPPHFSFDTVRERPSSTEVDVSYSMLRLCEELPHQQNEPLDLSISPIDLSAKFETPKQNYATIHSNISSQFMMPPPAHTSSPFTSKQSSHHNLLNYFNSLQFAHIPHSQAGSEVFMLRVQPPFQNKLMTSPPIPEIITIPSNDNTSTENTENSSGSENQLYMAEQTTSDVSSENGLTPACYKKQHSNDSEINDLASVSSVIDTANSQDISKFLNPATFSKTHSAKSELATSSLISKTNICRSPADNNKRFPCNQCNKSFDTSSALKRHMVIHTGVKKHKCSTCGKPFGTKSNCKRHELTHLSKNGQKPRDASFESQNTNDVSNNIIDFSNFSMTTDQSISEPSQNIGHDAISTHINSASNILTTFSHLLSGSYSTHNLECKYCLNTYKSMHDLSNHMKELHPSEYTNKINSFSQ